MILILHITVALASLVTTGLSAIFPSRKRLHISYGLIGLTLASGTVLVLTTHVAILHTCETGLVFLAVSLFGISVTSRRLSKDVS
jgi:hypothetical protein